MKDERRYKRFTVGSTHVLEWFKYAAKGYPQFVQLPFLFLPNDAVVHAVNFDWASNCFEFRVSHSSYPEVEWGQVIPAEPLVPQWHAVELKPFEDPDS